MKGQPARSRSRVAAPGRRVRRWWRRSAPAWPGEPPSSASKRGLEACRCHVSPCSAAWRMASARTSRLRAVDSGFGQRPGDGQRLEHRIPPRFTAPPVDPHPRARQVSPRPRSALAAPTPHCRRRSAHGVRAARDGIRRRSTGCSTRSRTPPVGRRAASSGSARWWPLRGLWRGQSRNTRACPQIPVILGVLHRINGKMPVRINRKRTGRFLRINRKRTYK